MSKNISAQELLDHINQRIEKGQYRDAVHKIKLMTAKEVIERVLAEDFWSPSHDVGINSIF